MKFILSMLGAVWFGSLAIAGPLNYTYDAGGRLLRVDYGGGTNTTYSFDPAGNLLSRATFASANPDLALSQTASPSPATAGSVLRYTLTVVNPSASSATGVVLTNVLPAGVTFLSASSSQGTVSRNGSIISAALGALTNGAAATVSIVVRPTTPGTILNSAAVAADQADPNPANNSSILLTVVLLPPSLALAVQGAALSFSWSVDAEGFLLQETGDLSPPIFWTTVSQPTPSIIGNEFVLPLNAPATNEFFRLAAP